MNPKLKNLGVSEYEVYIDGDQIGKVWVSPSVLQLDRR